MSGINLSDLDLSNLSAGDIASLAQALQEAETNKKAENEARYLELVQEVAEHVAAFGTRSDSPGRVWAGVNIPAVTVRIGGVAYAVNVSLTDLKRKAEKNLAKVAETDASA